MIIINAVECNNANTLHNLADKYLADNAKSVLFTDDIMVKNYVDSKHGRERCTYNSSLVGMWMRVEESSILFITKIHNTCSDVYQDLNNNYSIICIESAYEIDINTQFNDKFTPLALGTFGGV